MAEENNQEVESKEVGEEVLDETPSNGLSKGDTPDFKWYVAHVLSGYENRVKMTLKDRIINHNMIEYFAEIYVPEETVVSNVNGRKRNIKKKFLPGYVLLKMIMNDKTWHLVKNTDKITGFVSGNKLKPTPITDEEAMRMTNQEPGKVRRATSANQYSTGDQVKVIEGPFASFVGTVETVNEKGKLKVNVSIFGRPTPVELDGSQVEKA